jgi:hypothetical protein
MIDPQVIMTKDQQVLGLRFFPLLRVAKKKKRR